MNQDYIQHLRYKLQNRINRLNSTGHAVFHSELRQWWEFLHGNTLIRGILTELQQRPTSAEEDADRILRNTPLVHDSELESVPVAYYVIKKCVESDNELVEVWVGNSYGNETPLDGNLDHFRTIFVERLHDYIDEHLGDGNACLSLMLRYKHSCEWFQRKKLYEQWQQNPQAGERMLAEHLYSYLYDQGVDFIIEPRSASGKPDLVVAQEGEEPLIADAKIIDAVSRGKDYLAKGFRQIYQYTLDYNEPIGYLVIFNVSGKDLELSLEEDNSTPLVTHNGKIIFFINIDIFPYEDSASKRGKLRPVIITRSDLIQIIKATASVNA